MSVVVTTCSDPRRLERCLRSILACNYDDLEIVVVENRPGSGATRRMLATRFDDSPVLRYVEERRAGLSRAWNAGLNSARGELVAFVDDDTIVDPRWIERLVDRFGWSEDADCVTGLILPLELETPSQVLLEQFAGFGKGFERRTYRLREKGDGAGVYPYAPGAIGSGANTALRRASPSSLGGFDPTLGAGTPAVGGEDLDLYLRLLLRGHAIAYEPSAIVWHQHPDGAERLRSQVYRYGMGLGATFTKQLLRGPARRELIRAVPAGIRHAADPESRRKRAAKASGYPASLDRLERLGCWRARCVHRERAQRPLGTAAGEDAGPTRAVPPRACAWHAARTSMSSPSSRSKAPGSAPGAPHRRRSGCAGSGRVRRGSLAVALGLPAPMKFLAVIALMCVAPGAALITRLGGGLSRAWSSVRAWLLRPACRGCSGWTSGGRRPSSISWRSSAWP